MAPTSNGPPASNKRKSHNSDTINRSSKRLRTEQINPQSENLSSSVKTNTADIEHRSNGQEYDNASQIRKGEGRHGAPFKDEETFAAQKGPSLEKKSSMIETQLSSMDDRAENHPETSGLAMSLSAPSGGCFLDHDPIFVTSDLGEEFLVSGTDREIRLLALDSSSIIRRHLASSSTKICCYGVNPINENIVSVAYENGSTEQWNWRTGESSKTRNLGGGGALKALSTISLPDKKLLLVSLLNTKKHSKIYAGHKVLHKVKQKLEYLRVVQNGLYIVAYGSSTLLLGRKRDGSATELDYEWIELPRSSTPTSVDIRVVPKPSKESKQSSRSTGLSLAVGNEDGQIHLYDDVAILFNQKGQIRLPSPQILHWHRHALASVKFSADGVYLISGGMETVLVLWQLNTGKKQFLPHLTSAIERLTVNERGDRYALQMGDNSIMVLSTSELKPVANFAGLQMFPNADSRLVRNALCLHPGRPNHLLLAVPPSNPLRSHAGPNRPFLQTFDIQASRHVTRQALTRNNVTDFNEGPERTLIDTPDITHLAISSDGNWLASIDDWMPPLKDINHLAGNDLDLVEEQQKRREVHLKIWHWDEQQALWTLTTRADGPHARYNNAPGPGRILALIASPKDHGFVTVGEDSSVKVWRQKLRTRHGVVLKDEQDRDQVEWTCKRTVDLPFYNEQADASDDISSTLPPSAACGAFSDDGSILAINITGSDAEAQMVHFLDPLSGEITASKSGLANTGIVALGILSRHLVILSASAIYLWDMINGTMGYKRKLKPWPNPDSSRPFRMLAINHNDQTFAVATSVREEDKAKVEIFACDSSKVLYREPLDTSLEAVLTTKGVRGYKLVFANATTQILTPAGAILRDVSSSGDGAMAMATNPADSMANDDVPVAADTEMLDFSGSDVRTTGDDIIEDDRSVVRPEQLADIFDVGQSFALPPVKDMFHAVVKLFGREPIPLSQQVQVGAAS